MRLASKLFEAQVIFIMENFKQIQKKREAYNEP